MSRRRIINWAVRGGICFTLLFLWLMPMSSSSHGLTLKLIASAIVIHAYLYAGKLCKKHKKK